MSSARQASELIKLVQEYSGLSLGRIIYVAGLAGLCSTALIALVNYSAARVAAQDAPECWYESIIKKA